METPPWNIANRLSEFPYAGEQKFCVECSDGKKVAKKLKAMTPDAQTIFKGDRVIVLKGSSKGKVSVLVSLSFGQSHFLASGCLLCN